MARGPFQGTWQEGLRPTVVTAPDAIVYINGQPDLLACSSCRRRFDFNKYVTSVQVDLNIDNRGSANINLSVPRHTVDDFFVEGVPVVSPMMEVEIYAKGYYLVNGVPQYYPIFWGLVTEVSENYSGGEHTVSINCEDILKWWDLSRLNVNVAFTQAAGQLGRNYITGNAFHGANVYDIIWTLAQQSFGDIIQAKGSLVSSTREEKLGGAFNGMRQDLMSYWNARFGQMRSNLLLYGVEGAAVRGDVLFASQPTGRSPLSTKVASAAVRNANGGDPSSQVLFDPNSTIAFRSNIGNSGQPPLWQSEFETKLQIANTAKEAIGFEFFMDVTGDIVFKPPFYNLDVLGNKPVSWIQDVDIIDWNLSESESEVVTQLQMSGSFDGGPMDHGVTTEISTPTIQVTDYHLLRQYGWRVQNFNAEYLNDSEAMFYMGLDTLDRINAKRHRSTVTIPMRPELRLGFPVYLAPKDQLWYLTGVSHNLTFGGRAQTQLTLTARRGKFIAPRGIGTIEVKSSRKPGTQDRDARQEQAERDKVTNVPLAPRLRPTAKELSQFGSFKLKVGAAAETPPTTLQAKTLTDVSGDDPYAPLILRHPKTGRIVGYPNVNLAYTQPFAPDNATFRKVAGQNPSDKSKAERLRKSEGGTAARATDDQLAASLTQTAERTLLERHLDSRYSYGMTSAGVYTYVHDKSRVLQEIIQVPIKNIDVSSTLGTGTKLFGEGTATIRPVSDERGFEVIGHYLYGRGISLRDGSLVLSDGGRGRNTRAAVDTQLALAGGLFESLRAQSQGLTTISSTYANPAEAIAGIIPEDLQTAGMVNPATKEPMFVPNGLNYVDSAPLNSPANAGQAASVEASQLSRALTLAEMRAKEDVVPDSDCLCLTGRADLAFLNVGYQVQTLKPTAPDVTSQAQAQLQRTLVDARESLRRFEKQLARLRSKRGRDAAEVLLLEQQDRLVTEERDLARAHVAELEAQLDATVKASLDSTVGGDPLTTRLSLLGESVPIAPTMIARPVETLNRVESFLQKLYEALDGPHQAYEDALRGKLIQGRSRSQLITSNETAPAETPFTPPFSVSSRALGGDPEALALQGSSAVSSIQKSWKTFGDNLRTKPKRAALSRQIEIAKDKLQQLEAEEARLLAVVESGSLLVSAEGAAGQSTAERLAVVRADKAKASQEIDNASAKLRQLEAR